MHDNNFWKDWIDCGALVSLGNDQLLIGWGRRRWLAEPDPVCPSFYFPDYFLKNEHPWLIHENCRKMSTRDLFKELKQITIPDLKKLRWINHHQDLFNREFEKLQSLIAQGVLQKAVPFVIESSDIAMDCAQLQRSLKASLTYSLEHPAFVYGFWNNHEGMLGVTPEILFHYQGHDRLETMACAGTKAVDEKTSALLDDPKELYEHQLVVEGISESLSSFGKVNTGKRQLLKLSQLMHLVTPLSVQLTSFSLPPFHDLVNALHPTPAVGAFPKKEGKFWLENYQQQIDRLRFGAPSGYFFPENRAFSCYVSIRNVQWNKDKMFIAAGCGVVAKSHREKEWEEINLKLKAVKEMLAL